MDERAWLSGQLAREETCIQRRPEVDAFAAFGRVRVWMLVVVYLGETTSAYGVGLWLPSLLP